MVIGVKSIIVLDVVCYLLALYWFGVVCNIVFGGVFVVVVIIIFCDPVVLSNVITALSYIFLMSVVVIVLLSCQYSCVVCVAAGGVFLLLALSIPLSVSIPLFVVLFSLAAPSLVGFISLLLFASASAVIVCCVASVLCVSCVLSSLHSS